MENNLNMIKQFPSKIKKVNLKNEKNILEVLDGYKLFSINLENENKTNKQLFGIKDNKIYVINNKIEITNELKTSEEDNISYFGYTSSYYNKVLYISGFNNVGYPIIYLFNTENYELISKIQIENFTGAFNIIIIKNKMYFIQTKDKQISVYIFKIENINIIKDDVIRLDLESDDIIFSMSPNYLFLANNNNFYTIDTINYKIISKVNKQINTIETFYFKNLCLTFVVDDNVEILDSNLSLRQKIELPNISQVKFTDSYLILINEELKIVYIYALNQNGLFTEFGLINDLGNFTSIDCCYNKLFISKLNESRIITECYYLPKRIYNLEKFIGFGYYVSNDLIEQNNNKSILINNGKLSSHCDSNCNYSLLVGYTNKVSDIFIQDEKPNNKVSIQYEFLNNINVDLKKDYVVISDDFKINDLLLNKEMSNYIFIESFNYDLFIKSTQGSSITLIINKLKKIITWSKDSILKLEICNNDSIIEIHTESNVEILGYIENKESKFNIDIKLISNSNDLLINDRLLSNYNSFLPYYDNDKISGIVSNPISNLETEFKLIPINSNLIDFSSKSNISINDFNQQFYKRYLIENNDNLIIVTDILINKKINEFNTKDIGNIKKIIYTNPLMIILSKTQSDTSLYLVNLNNSNISPYMINNTSSENLTELFAYSNYRLVFVSIIDYKYIIYIINLDDSDEVIDMKKINHNEKVSKMKIYENLLVVELEDKEIIIYDLENMTTLISIRDNNILDFDIFYNYLFLLIKEEQLKLFIYKIKPDFELLLETEIEDFNENTKLNFGSNRLLINDNDKIVIYNYDEVNGMKKIEKINEKLVHFYKNILITQGDNIFNLYKFSPKTIYLDSLVYCSTNIDYIKLKNKEDIDKSVINLFLEVTNKSLLKIENKIINFKNFCNYKCIVKIIIELLDNKELTIQSIEKNSKLCAIIEGVMKDKLPCFLPGTLILTPKGEIPIENLKENDIIFNDKMEEINILSVHKWETSEYTKNNIPYIIPADSLKNEYPKYDTSISPFHKIKLPNGDFKRVEEINLPFIKQYRTANGNLRSNNKIIEKIVYYNFILDDNSYFIANGLIVESLDKSNPHL
tara:strand:+ start:2151 stop:5426 length:3276 start_codon:yes stop_codon:yes gene_type:complete